MCAVPSVPGANGVQGGKPLTSFHASLVVACIVAVSFVGAPSPPPGSRDTGASGPSAGPGPRFAAGGPDARRSRRGRRLSDR